MDVARVSRVRETFESGEARRMREQAHLSLEELASMAGIPKSTLAGWEAGRRPSAEGALAWAKAMERLGFKV